MLLACTELGRQGRHVIMYEKEVDSQCRSAKSTRNSVAKHTSAQQLSSLVCCRYDRFTFDITDALLVRDVSTHEVVMRIYSPLDAAHIPIGKQRLHVPARSIFYSASSGIWQTVWLELVRNSDASPTLVMP